MKVTTESGSVYDIDDHGICIKTNADGERVHAFKVFTMKSFLTLPSSWEEIHQLPESRPKVGQHLFVSGRDVWWISTKVVSVT
jgi:hypothetical protein